MVIRLYCQMCFWRTKWKRFLAIFRGFGLWTIPCANRMTLIYLYFCSNKSVAVDLVLAWTICTLRIKSDTVAALHLLFLFILIFSLTLRQLDFLGRFQLHLVWQPGFILVKNWTLSFRPSFPPSSLTHSLPCFLPSSLPSIPLHNPSLYLPTGEAQCRPAQSSSLLHYSWG